MAPPTGRDLEGDGTLTAMFDLGTHPVDRTIRGAGSDGVVGYLPAPGPEAGRGGKSTI